MKNCKSKTFRFEVWKRQDKTLPSGDFCVFSGKFKKKSYFSLNSGNFYVTLQPELCPVGSWEWGTGRVYN